MFGPEKETISDASDVNLSELLALTEGKVTIIFCGEEKTITYIDEAAEKFMELMSFKSREHQIF